MAAFDGDTAHGVPSRSPSRQLGTVHDDRGLEGPRQGGETFVGGSERLPSVVGLNFSKRDATRAPRRKQVVDAISSARLDLASCDSVPGGTSSQEEVGQHHSGRVLPSCYRREPALAFDAGLFFTPAPTAAGSSSLSSSSSESAASAALWLMPASASGVASVVAVISFSLHLHSVIAVV